MNEKNYLIIDPIAYVSMKFVTTRATNLEMEQYMKMDIQSLVDLVVVYTQQYNRMLSTKVYDEEQFTHCRQTLAELHSAIKVKGERDGCDMGHISPNLPFDDLKVRSSNLNEFSQTVGDGTA